MSKEELLIFATVAGSVVAFGVPAVLALAWAARSKQFDNLERDSASIFGPDEPVGEVTDMALAEDRHDQ